MNNGHEHKVRAAKPRDWVAFRNILCVRPDNLGDVLMTTPAIQALRESADDRRITLLTSTAGAAIARHVPAVDASITFDPPWYRHDRPQDRDGLAGIISTLAERRFDAAVIFTVFSQNPLPTAMLCYMAGIPRVAGYCRENPYALVTDWFPDREPLYGARHEVQRQLDLVTLLGATPTTSNLSLRVPGGHEEAVLAKLHAAGITADKPWLLLHPGASEARRRYPAEHFAATAKALHRELGVQVVLTGSAAERELAASIAAAAGDGTVSVAGRLDLDELIVLIAMSTLLISNNTGPVHIAAAVQTPVVVLYARTNPQHTPWQVAHRVLPFDVPVAARSRNVLVGFAGERFFGDSVGAPTPVDIVAAARDLLATDTGDASIRRAAPSPAFATVSVAPPTG